MWHRALTVLVVPLAAPAVLAAQEPVDLLTDVPTRPPDRECAESERPDALPTVRRLADSASLASAVAGLSSPKLDRRYALFSLHYGADGSLAWVALLRTNLPEDTREAVAGALLPHLAREAGGERWTVRLAVSFGPSPGFLVGRSEVCPAERVEDGVRQTGTIVQRSTGPGAAPSPPRELRTTRPYRIRVKVSPAGRAVDVRMVQGSGSRLVDDGVRDVAKAARYLPELHDGIPVVGWYEEEARSW